MAKTKVMERKPLSFAEKTFIPQIAKFTFNQKILTESIKSTR